MKYTTTFAAGGLLQDESVEIVKQARDRSLKDVSSNILDIASRGGRDRKAREVVRRLESIAPHFWQDLPSRPFAEQAAVLYYSCMKTYLLIRDLHFGLVLPAWRSVGASVQPHEVRRHLEKRSEMHPEIEDWSGETRSKVQQVFRKMLSEVGLLNEEGRLQKVNLPDVFWRRFVAEGDTWFLEAMLLGSRERNRIAGRPRRSASNAS